MRNKINRYDIALIVFIIITNFIILAYGGLNTKEKGQKIAYVYSDKKIIGEYAITDNYKTEFKVELDDGNYNTIHIEDSKIWIREATCPDKVCLHQGKISHDGELIVCIPNKLLIQIKDKNEAETEDEIDIIVK